MTEKCDFDALSLVENPKDINVITTSHDKTNIFLQCHKKQLLQKMLEEDIVDVLKQYKTHIKPDSDDIKKVIDQQIDKYMIYTDDALVVFMYNWYFKHTISDDNLANYLERFFNAKSIDELSNFRLYFFGPFLRETITTFYVNRLVEVLPMLDYKTRIDFTLKLDSSVIHALYDLQPDLIPMPVLRVKYRAFKTDADESDHEAFLSSANQTDSNKYIYLHYEQLSFKTILKYTDSMDIILKLIYDPAKFTESDVPPGLRQGSTYDKLVGCASNAEDFTKCLYEVKQYDFPKVRFLCIINMCEELGNEHLYTALQAAYAEYEELET
jgi:hypothetical protein